MLVSNRFLWAKCGRQSADAAGDRVNVMSDKGAYRDWEVITKVSRSNIQWGYGHIVIQVTQMHLNEINPHFEKEDTAWEVSDSEGRAPHVTGHQRKINISNSGFGKAYSNRLRLDLARNRIPSISQTWHRRLGIYKGAAHSENAKFQVGKKTE